MRWSPVFLLLLPPLAGGLAAQQADGGGPGTGPESAGGEGALAAQAQRAVDRARTWLLDRQLLDGSWDGFSQKYRGGITGLCVYTLAQSGLPADHPAIVRGIEYLRTQPPEHTYSAGSLLLAIGARGDPEDLEWAQEVCAEMLEWMRPNGLFGYPGGHADLSNTLFAVLGLNAAADLGVRIPDKTWARLLAGALGAESREERVELADGGRAIETGFSYTPGSGASGSMASAGITVLEIAKRRLGRRIGARDAKASRLATKRSLLWLGRHWDLSKNPPNRTWRFYHLYGLERVGSLLEVEIIGTHDWYREGTEYLLAQQTDAGTWHEGYMGGLGASERADYEELNTCMGILFLRRATQLSLTGTKSAAAAAVYDSEDTVTGVVLRASGDTPLTLWVARGADGAKGAEFFARSGRTWGDPVSLGRAESGAGRLSVQHAFDLSGPWEVWCEVETAAGTLRSAPLTVRIEHVLEEPHLGYAGDAARNLLRATEWTVSATSQLDEKHAPASAFDGRIGQAWLAAPEDPAPRIELTVQRALRCERILFTAPRPRPADQERPRPRGLEITVNRGRSYMLEMPRDEGRKGVLELGRRIPIRSVVVRVVSAWDGETGAAPLGFAEIELQ